MKTLLTDGWSFSRQALATNPKTLRSPGAAWVPVDLPHDWLIDDVTRLPGSAEGWYRRELAVEPGAGVVALRFEGAYQDSTVFLNGRSIFEWKHGYSTFEVDLTDHLAPGVNEVLVRTVVETPHSRWYSGAGLYRNVWLLQRPACHLVSDGVYVSTQKEGNLWEIWVDAEVVVPGAIAPDAGLVEVVHTVFDAEGAAVCRSSSLVTSAGMAGTEINHQRLVVEGPAVWDLDHPVLYTLETLLTRGGVPLDQVSQRFGFRTMACHPTEGFVLNGRRVSFQGVCQHHDLGCLGAAMSKVALRRQLVLLKEMGVNAIRTAHNMPAVELMDLADDMGLLVVSESFDMWERSKNPFDYARFFGQWAEKDVTSWVRRDRNHPSLVMWCIGNEIYDTHASDRGRELTVWLTDLVHRLDPRRNAEVTLGSNFMPWENAQKCADVVKLAGYNYGEKYYQAHHRDHPDWVIYGSETGSVVQSRGIYHFPASQPVLADDDDQCSSLGNSATSWGAKSTVACITADRDTPFSLGQFVWSGFDYLGEPTPYFTKNSYFGQLDTAGFKKDSFFLFQAEWTDHRKAPMVHLFPYWDFNPGQRIDVRVCSNAPRVELFRDGTSLGAVDLDHRRGQNLLGEWQLEYAPGTLVALAYDESGRVIARDSVTSFGDAVALVAVADKPTLSADGVDLVFVEISTRDAQGVAVANANNRVTVTVTGAGRLVGLDNGDSSDFDQYKGVSRCLFSGKLLAVVAATPQPGPVVVSVTSHGLAPVVVELEALPADRVLSAAILRNQGGGGSTEVPVRKIEIVSPAGRVFDGQNRSLTVRARLHPANATDTAVEWRVTNDAGITSNLAEVAAHGLTASVTARGDGEFRLRCATRNGSGKIRLYSQLEFTAQGLGKAYLDPYSLVSGGLYTRGKGELGNGNDRGVATPRDGESRLCFDGLDFGDFGSDLLTLPLFALDSEPFPVEIWEGMPGDPASERLTTVTYHKPTRWNTYQEATYQLPRRLKGVSSLGFVLRRKVHLKGFWFTRLEKAFSRLGARDCDAVYGDAFTLTPDTIEEIGNNVSIEFRHLDFGTTGCRTINLCGRTHRDKNTLHLRWEGGEGNQAQVVEFPLSPEYTEHTFDLEPVTGTTTFTLVFLPGSRFDLKALQFGR